MVFRNLFLSSCKYRFSVTSSFSVYLSHLDIFLYSLSFNMYLCFLNTFTNHPYYFVILFSYLIQCVRDLLLRVFITLIDILNLNFHFQLLYPLFWMQFFFTFSNFSLLHFMMLLRFSVAYNVFGN